MKIVAIVELFFRIVVLATMLYFIWKQTSKFFVNNCVPTLTYKKFLQSSNDIYPQFTFCLENGIGMYNDMYLNKFGINASEYQDFLTGGEVNETTQSKMKRIVFNESLIEFPRIGLMYRTIGQNATGGGVKTVWKQSLSLK